MAGRISTEKIVWTTELTHQFSHAKDQLSSHKSITIPTPSDRVWIVTDGALKSPGLGATMYVTRGDGPRLLAGFYSTKLHKRQVDWISSEVEALSIAAAVSHFSPFIVQSQHRTIVMSDSKPCVDAFAKLCRGEFSLSACVVTFLTTLSRYQCEIRHLKWINNVLSDYQSRNANICDEIHCEICTFV